MKRTSMLLIGTAALSFGVAQAAMAECSPDYTGVEITATTQTGPYIASALALAAKGWAEKKPAVRSRSSNSRGRNSIPSL